MFQFQRDDEGLTVRVSGKTTKAIDEIADVLELDVQWPIFLLALDNLYKMCKVHVETKEELRDIVMLDSKEKKGMFLFDIEALKVEAKKMEIQGLADEEGEYE